MLIQEPFIFTYYFFPVKNKDRYQKGDMMADKGVGAGTVSSKHTAYA